MSELEKVPVQEVKERVRKPYYLQDDNADRLTTIPSDWNPDDFQMLRRKDFADESVPVFMEWRAGLWDVSAADCAAKAADLRSEAAIWSSTGGKAGAAKAKSYKALMAKMAELEAELSSLPGIDLAALKASI